MLDIDVQDHDLDFLTLLEHLGGMFDPLFPGNVRHMDETVDSLLHADKYSEVGDVSNDSLDNASLRIFRLERLPGVGRGLFQPK